jgi:uncharacterized protein (TIGR02444 family)
MTEISSGHPCWTFALELYAKPGVSAACLLLQDRLGVDVSFLLTMEFYAERRGVDLSTESIASLDRYISAWRNEVITPLRSIRRRMKNAELLLHPTNEFYRRIKADELQAEQIEISALAYQLEQMSGTTAAASTHDAIERVITYFANASSNSAHLADIDIRSAVAILHRSVNQRRAFHHEI